MKTKMQMYVWGVIVIAGIIGMTGWNECFADEPFSDLVTTKLGQLQGVYNTENTVAWYSVPFAKPPVDDLRWRAPQPLDAWDGVRDATTMCEPCTQKTNAPLDDFEEFGNAILEGKGEMKVVGSEDCLYMNIFRPNTEARDLPVYVYIHGGGNYMGAMALYDGSYVAEKGNMIFIAVQYRLGPLGFFSHPALRKGESLADDSGSFGTLDNIQALRWIQENIASFGGDPNNVTVAGQSAGGFNVMNLLISPMAKGLFQKAMIESSGGVSYTREEAELLSNRIIELLLEKDGYTNDDWDSWDNAEKEAYLKTASNEDVIEISSDNALLIPPIQSPGVIPGGLVDLLRKGQYHKVPVILGINKYEYKSFMAGAPGAPLYNIQAWADLPKVLNGETTLDELFPTQFDKDLWDTTADYGSRFWRYQAVDERARVMNKHQDNIYTYRFDWCGPEPFAFIQGAQHGMEIPFFLGMYDMLDAFDTVDLPGNSDYSRYKDNAIGLMDIMVNYLVNFTQTGNPNGENLPVWEPWSNDDGEPKIVLLDADDEQVKIEMSYEELNLRDTRKELKDKIAQWPPFKRMKHRFVPYIMPLSLEQLQPEQIAIDLGIFGEYTWNTGYWMRQMMIQMLISGNINITP